MIRAFIDASVIYASIISPTGAARELLRRHTTGEVQLVVSDYVLEEVERNLKAKNPDNAGSVKFLLGILALEIVEVDVTEIKAAAEYTEPKDAPVVAAAQKGNCEYLLTFDKKHLLGKELLVQRSGVKIITPGDLMQILREKKS